MNEEYLKQTKKISERMNRVKYRIAVMSGKGGVGKSVVSAMVAIALAKQGKKVGLLDGDITGASIPRMFGLTEKLSAGENGILPVVSRLGVKVVSINLLLEAESQAVIWRGPLIAGVIRQLLADTDWGDLDFLVIDLPPGTSDAQLAVLQSLRLSGVVLVASPQALVEMVVMKAVDMLRQTNTRIAGLIMNMSTYRCPQCGILLHPFGEHRGSGTIEKSFGVPLLCEIPIDPQISILCDSGKIEDYECSELFVLAGKLPALLDALL
ncbi:MAG: Mrp/NBP35 family ATP-binding protein [Thermoplasmata archaeon]|nr:Mrp/NBP35 family ATP-binding protein [Thermoplasmata archaeon]